MDGQTKKSTEASTEEQNKTGASHKGGDKSAGGEKTDERDRRQDRLSNVGNTRSGMRLRGASATSTPVRKITVENLKGQLRKLKLPTTGNKAELQHRLKDYEIAQEESDYDSDTEGETINETIKFQKPDIETDDEDEQRSEDADSAEESDDEEDEGRRRGQETRRNNTTRSRHNPCTTNNINIKDVEDSISHFSGDDQTSVERWIDEFEDMSELLQWSDLQKVIYAKKLLRGSAKQFVALQKGLTTWKIMKKRMLREFQTKHNSATVHSQLVKRKRLPNETPRQYIYAMQTIASQGNVEEEALIQYVIDGIPDEENNKSILYGSESIRQLRTNLERYDRMKERSDKKNKKEQPKNTKGKVGERSGMKTTSKERRENRCFSCGATEHVVNDCPHKDEGPKCFKCNKFGHIATRCNSTSEATKRERKVNMINMNNRAPTDDEVMIMVNGVPVPSMIDTGTHRTLLRFSEYQRIGKPPIRNVTQFLYGLGNMQVMPTGVFWATLTIQGDQYRIEVYVVPDKAMDSRMLLGKELTRQMDIRIRGGMLSIRKLSSDTKEEGDIRGEERKERNYDDRPLSDEKVKYEVRESDSRTEEEEKHEGEDDEHKEGSELDTKEKQEDAWETGKILADAISEMNAVNYTQADLPDIEACYRYQIQQLTNNYIPKEHPQTNTETRIILQDQEPVCSKPRRLAVKEKIILDQQIEEWLREGVIQPSHSRYASPVVIVPKKNGAYRVCVDYRKLNRKIVRDRFPMPRIDDRIDSLANARVFSVLDLKNGFFHVPVAAESRQYTSFVTPEGQYEFLKTPFGLCNSPTSFLRYIDEIFSNLSKKHIVFTYMDDLIVPGRNEEEALTNLEKTLAVAAEGGLIINWKKCTFLQKRVEYLGHIIEDGRVGPSPTKIKGVRHFPIPKTKKALQSFLGLTGYFRKFIQDYARIARPLSDILKSGRIFRFEEEQRRAFEELKRILTTEPVLQIYRPEAITELHTDASKEGYGAVLLQKPDETSQFKPVYYMSRKTTDAEKKLHSYELEALAIVQAVKKFRVYLLGVKFRIVTDCSAFQKTLNKVDITPKVARWALTLEEFDYEIEHRPGTRLKHADALSRYPVMVVEPRLTPMIRKQQDEEERLRVIKKILETEPYEDYSCENNILMKRFGEKNVMVLPTSMHHDTIRKAHDNGHFGVKKMMEDIRSDYYIPKLKDKLEKYVSCCIPCILAEAKRGKKESELMPIPKGDVPLATYHIDHLGPMTTTSKSYKYLFVVVDGFSKFVWIYPTKTTNAREVLDKLQSQQKVFGNPRRIISDRGSAFTSDDFQKHCVQENIEHILITTGVPRGNGQVERINRIIIPILTKLAHDQPGKWFRYVDRVQTAINSTYQRSIGTSPFEVLFGVKMRRKEDPELLSLIELESIAGFEDERQELRNQAREKIAQIQRENKRTHDRKCKAATQYALGDLVAIKRTQYGPGLKIKDKYFGPYKISKKKGNHRYEVIKEAEVEGPWMTSASADQMKPYLHYSSGTEE